MYQRTQRIMIEEWKCLLLNKDEESPWSFNYGYCRINILLLGSSRYVSRSMADPQFYCSRYCRANTMVNCVSIHRASGDYHYRVWARNAGNSTIRTDAQQMHAPEPVKPISYQFLSA